MQVVFYKNKKGEEPAIDFLNSLDPKMTRTINLLEVNGYKLRDPYTKSLRDGILNYEQKKEVILLAFYIFM